MPPRRARHHRCRRHTSPTDKVFTTSSNGATVWCPAMVPPAGKNDAPWAPPPSPLTTSVKAFARMSTSPIHTVPVVAIAHPQQLPQLPCRKRFEIAETPPQIHRQAPANPPQLHHHDSAGTAGTTKKRGGAPPAHHRSPCPSSKCSIPLPLTTPGRDGPKLTEVEATNPGHHRPAQPRPSRPCPRHPPAARPGSGRRSRPSRSRRRQQHRTGRITLLSSAPAAVIAAPHRPQPRPPSPPPMSVADHPHT
jgi:hypothetical protein